MRNHCYENDFDLHENKTVCKTHFHMKGFAFRLILKQRHKKTCGNGLFKELLLFKFLHGLAPEYRSFNFERRETAYNLRDFENKLNVPLQHIS